MNPPNRHDQTIFQNGVEQGSYNELSGTVFCAGVEIGELKDGVVYYHGVKFGNYKEGQEEMAATELILLENEQRLD